MSDAKKPITRRGFLEMVGLAGGSAAVYESMVALGIVQTPTAWAGPLASSPDQGAGETVLVLGSGIGGLTAAYELTRAGFTVEVLEAQNRAGGRSLTARRGTRIHEDGEGGPTTQTCRFDEGLYLNMGPGRLPYHHRRALHYCSALGVPLEIYVMDTTANLFQTQAAFDGEAVPRRQISANIRGYISELLAKSISTQCLDEDLSKEDQERMLSLLRVFGDLDASHHFQGSTRAGCAHPPTVSRMCEPPPPVPLQKLLSSDFWQQHYYQPQEFEWQPTLFQPVGGMDQIVEGFKRQIGHLITYHADVREISLTDDGMVEVTYEDRRFGHICTKKAHHCVSNIPLPVLAKRRLQGFSDDYRKAIEIGAGNAAAACKVGWQANQRFWENDRNQIYGGISYIDHIITQMWYPSYDYFTANGTLTGLYNYTQDAERFGRLNLRQRLAVARSGAVRLHEQFRDDAIVPDELGLSIAWKNVPFQRASWIDWSSKPDDLWAYSQLLMPDKERFFVVGDQISTLPGWQEGAMMSAEFVVSQLLGELVREMPRVLSLPSVTELATGMATPPVHDLE